MDHLPRYEFQKCVSRYRGDYQQKSFSCWDQFLTMVFAQLTYRESLRDIEACLHSMSGKLYHMGFRGKVARSTLADANELRDWRIYAEFAQVLIRIARPLYARDPIGVDFLEYLGKPVMVGEFHMGATDRGMFHTGLVSTPDQEARAAMFTDYVRSVVDNPVFVGCHYFKYADEPLTGRPGDGENYSIGFTTVVDGLYPEMVEAAKKVSGEMYQRRSR